ncbi:hypothetical protein LSAT2_025002 [Lamellibrachia satsuma]|nr:hypothetical protein LSAT2_025002 [Lamellibrachia satsuma]
MGSARAGSPKATTRRAKRKRSQSTKRHRSSKRVRSHSCRGSKKRSMRSGHKGKASRSGKRRALVRRSSPGRSSLGSQRIKGKVVKATVVKANLTKEMKSPKHAVSAFFHFITHERALAKKQKAKLLPMADWTQALGKKWRGMTTEEQLPFQMKAQQDKLRYQQEIAKFNEKSGFLVFLDDFGKDNKGESKNILTAGRDRTNTTGRDIPLLFKWKRRQAEYRTRGSRV